MEQPGSRKVFAEITNTVVGPKEAWREDSDDGCGKTKLPLAPHPEELDLLGPCTRELHRAWTTFASSGGSTAAYLLQHYAALGSQALLAVPALPPLPSEEVLAWALAPGEDVDVEREERQETWSEVMRGVASTSVEGPSPASVAAPERQQSHWQRTTGAASSSGAEEPPLERCLSFEEVLDSPRAEDDSKEAMEGRDPEEDLLSEGCGSEGEELVPPSWRQKELCEAELENRLAELLQQEHLSFDEEEMRDDTSEAPWSSDSAASCGSRSSWPPAHAGDSVRQADVGMDDGPVPSERWVFRTPKRRTRKTVLAGAGQVLTGVPRAAPLRGGEGEGTCEVDGALVAMTKCLLQVYHRETKRCQPHAQAIVARFNAAERALTVDWLLQSCHAMGFPEVVPFAALSFLDRYCSLLPVVLPTDHMQVLFLAVVSIALKMHGASPQVSAPLRDILCHLGQYRIPVELILEHERKVLVALDFHVSTPTAQELLDLLAMPSTGQDEDAKCERCRGCTEPEVWQLAGFLLRLAMRDVGLLYQYPHSVLATSAAYLALWSSQAGIEPCVAAQGSLLRRLRLASERPRVSGGYPASAGEPASSGWAYHDISSSPVPPCEPGSASRICYRI
eukprot:TRINITY_DN47911_c0_g1_i1.p1 TRINITY_DN47911_c0_g1~~TRINITY_DN47911_c0_g1_i1.p1  ORF type:complete len:648 (-),score=122.85 TRINITY_DN47911_c0_g1_i1:82-1941(-)